MTRNELNLLNKYKGYSIPDLKSVLDSIKLGTYNGNKAEEVEVINLKKREIEIEKDVELLKEEGCN